MMRMFLIFCFLFSFAHAQLDLMVGKWQMEYIELEGDKEMLGEDERLYVVFHSDNLFDVSEDGDSYSGEWQYVEKEKAFITKDRDGIEMHYILYLSEQELVYKDVGGGVEFVMYFKRVID